MSQGLYHPSAIDRACASFHVNHSLKPGFRAHLPENLKILQSVVSTLSDSVWESIKYAPNMFGVDRSSGEKMLTKDQLDALSLIVDYVKSRKSPQLRLCYSIDSITNPMQDALKLPKYVMSIMEIFEESLKNCRPDDVKTFVDQHSFDFHESLQIFQQLNPKKNAILTGLLP